jgi:CCR4-NOT transcription complex subunit 1
MVRRAGHLMVQTLAGSLALVTCKEPLKSNLMTHVRQFLVEHGFNEVRLIFLFQSHHAINV